MTSLRALAVLWASALLGAPAAAQEARGYAELRATLTPGTSGQRWQLVEQLRPSLQTDFGRRVRLVATLEADLAQGRDLELEVERTLQASAFGPLLDQAGCAWPTPTNQSLRVDGVADYLSVDRLYLDVYGEALDLRVGRQSVHWGSAYFFNPTDPFRDVLLTEPWRPRRGVNALRMTVPLGGLDDLTVLVGTDDTLQETRASWRLRLNHGDTDYALVGALRGDRGEGLLGVDVRGTLGVGYWLEASWVAGAEGYGQVAAGFDYSFPVLEQLLVLAQYYGNGAGATNPDDYRRTATMPIAAPVCRVGDASFLGTKATDPYAPFTLARDYLLVGATAVVVPDLSVNLFGLQNLDDGTGLFIPTISWAAAGWLEVSLSAQLPYVLWGPGGEFVPRPGDLVLSRDLGPYGVVSADLSGLVPDATLTLWTRASF